MTVSRTLLLAAAALAFSVTAASAASFNCKKAATATERAICGNVDLSDADSRMASLFFTVIGQSSIAAQIKRDQKTFIRNRNGCGGNIRCLGSLYQIRIQELQDEVDGGEIGSGEEEGL